MEFFCLKNPLSSAHIGCMNWGLNKRKTKPIQVQDKVKRGKNMLLLDGKIVAEKVKNQLTLEAAKFLAERGRKPGLGVILVGDDPASQVYVGNKIKTSENLGFYSKALRLRETASQAEVEAAVARFNEDPEIDAFLVQLPLPASLNKDQVLAKIFPSKDADGLTAENLGLLMQNRVRVKPCTPSGIMKILEHYQIPVAGKKVLVVGRSQIVGLPMAQLLIAENATVTVAHSKTRDLKSEFLAADIVIVAVGQPEFFGQDYFKPSHIVVDVGIHRIQKTGVMYSASNGSRLVGDVKQSEVRGQVAALTPVPGGVGPMTIACLLENTLILAKNHIQKGISG